MDTFQPTPGPVLRQRRKSLGISVTALSAAAGVTRATIHAWERHHELDAKRVGTYLVGLRRAET